MEGGSIRDGSRPPPTPNVGSYRPQGFGDCRPTLVRHASLMKTRTLDVPAEPEKSRDKINSEFLPIVRSGEWADIGFRRSMEDAYVCGNNFMHQYGLKNFGEGPSAFYGVTGCGKCGGLKGRTLPERQSYQDIQGPQGILHQRKNPNRILWRLSVCDGCLNGRLNVACALGDFHMEGLKGPNSGSAPVIASSEVMLTRLTEENKFLIMGCDGSWDVFRSQNAMDFARRKLQEHNDPATCCKELIYSALKRKSADNVAVVVVCFHSKPPPVLSTPRPRVQRSISAEGLKELQSFLDSLGN